MRRVALTSHIFAALLVLASTWPGPLWARPGRPSPDQVRSALSAAERRWSGPVRSKAKRQSMRVELARVGSMLRKLAPGTERAALRGRFQALSDKAFVLRHGLSRRMHKNLLRIERLQRGGKALSSSSRGVLAKIGRQLRGARTKSSRAMLQRFRRALSIAQYDRGTAPGSTRPGFNSSVELETKLTHQIVRMLELKGEKTIGKLLERAAGLPRPTKLNPEQLDARRQELRRAEETLKKIEAELRTAALSGKRVKPTEDQISRAREAQDTLEMYTVQLSYDLALQKVEQLARGRKKQRQPGDLSWRAVRRLLGTEVLTALLRGAMANTGNFFGDRSLPLVQFGRGKIGAYLDRRATYGGKTIEPGYVKLDHGLLPKVEFMSPGDATILRGVELHRLQQGKAGTNSSDAYKVMRALGSDMRHQHVHLPFKVSLHRREPRKKGGVGRALMLADHWRRTNLLFELVTAGLGGWLGKNEQGGATYFDFSNGQQVAQLNQHLRGARRLGSDDLKMAAVGYRVQIYKDSATKQTDKTLEGYEVRSIQNDHGITVDAKQRESILNAIQRTLTTGDYGLSQRAVSKWYRGVVRSAGGWRPPQEQVLESLHYNRGTISSLVSQAPKHVTGLLNSTARETLLRHGDENYGVKMLVHDWKQDTIWLGLPRRQRAQAIARVHKAQVEALRSLASRPDPDGRLVASAVAGFVRSSGLKDVVSRSLGLPRLKVYDPRTKIDGAIAQAAQLLLQAYGKRAAGKTGGTSVTSYFSGLGGAKKLYTTGDKKKVKADFLWKGSGNSKSLFTKGQYINSKRWNDPKMGKRIQMRDDLGRMLKIPPLVVNPPGAPRRGARNLNSTDSKGTPKQIQLGYPIR